MLENDISGASKLERKTKRVQWSSEAEADERDTDEVFTNRSFPWSYNTLVIYLCDYMNTL